MIDNIAGKIIKADSDGNLFYVGEYEVIPLKGCVESLYDRPIQFSSEETNAILVMNPNMVTTRVVKKEKYK